MLEAFVATDLEQINVNNGKAVYPTCPQIYSAPSFPWKSIVLKKKLKCKTYQVK